MAVIIAALLVSMLLHILWNKREQEQQEQQLNVESKLPFGNYLPTAENPLIRVVLKTNGFQQITHNEVKISCASGLIIYSGGVSSTDGATDSATRETDSTDGGTDSTTRETDSATREVSAGEIFTIKPDDAGFQTGSIRIEPKTESERITIHSLTRGYGTPSYRGVMELYSSAEGIVIVNEVPLEEYLCAVVPSEMPASYAPEALKCQAVCARSYAYCQMLAFAYPVYNAHVDDSVSFQVYGNSKEQESTTYAVIETAGKKLQYCNEVVKTYYYSTSCGHSTGVEAWGTALTEANNYLRGVSICNEAGEAYEAKLPWYRWKAVIPQKTLSNLIELNTKTEIGTLRSLTITKQGAGGVALQLVAKGTRGSVTVDTENKIRASLGGSGYTIEKQDGTVVKSTKLLPSAFFTIAKHGENYIIEGGGYGHGIGMSQNGANEMAKAGKTYEEILTFFYPGTKVE